MLRSLSVGKTNVKMKTRGSVMKTTKTQGSKLLINSGNTCFNRNIVAENQKTQGIHFKNVTEFILKMSHILHILHYRRVYGLQYLFTVRWTIFSKVLLMCSCSKHLRVYGLQYLFMVRWTIFSKVLLMCSCSKHLRVYGLQYLFMVRWTILSYVSKCRITSQ